jgi:hypothetical protein
VLCTNVRVMETFCLLCRICQDTLTLVRERKIHAGRQLFPDRDTLRNVIKICVSSQSSKPFKPSGTKRKKRRIPNCLSAASFWTLDFYFFGTFCRNSSNQFTTACNFVSLAAL